MKIKISALLFSLWLVFFGVGFASADEPSQWFEECNSVCLEEFSNPDEYQGCVRTECSENYGCEEENQSCKHEGTSGTCKLTPNRLLWTCISGSVSSQDQSGGLLSSAPASSYPLSAQPGAKCDPGFEEKAGVCFPTNSGLPDPSGGVLEILGSFLSWLFAIFSIFSVGAFVISGIQYLISAGDTGVIDTAKRNMKWSVVGIIIGLSGFLILKAVISALSGSAIF